MIGFATKVQGIVTLDLGELAEAEGTVTLNLIKGLSCQLIALLG